MSGADPGTGALRRAVMAAVAALVGAGAGAQTAEDFAGDWTRGNPAACVRGQDSPDLALRIGGGTLRGYEGACTMANPVAIRNTGAVAFEMDCSAEGDRWTSRAIFMIDRDGQLVYLWDGEAVTLQRCTAFAGAPAPGPRPAPRKSARTD